MASQALAASRYGNYDTHFVEGTDEVLEDGTLVVSRLNRESLHYPGFLPTWNPNEKYPPLKFFKHEDPGLRANPELPTLFPKGGDYKIRKITPKFGTEIKGVQLSQLDDAGKDELALYVAQKGIVVFRDQDFAKHGPEFAVKYGQHFGRLHIHPTSGAPKGHSELHITYRRADPGEFERVFLSRNSSIEWHSDISYELQPPGTTFFAVLEGPESGGDTIFADTVEAYKRLSPAMQKRLEGLHVLHSSEGQALNSRVQGGIERRKPVSHIHPIVRTHPVTKEKALYVSRPFSRQIVELKKEESDMLLNFLYDLIAKSNDLQLRANWEPNSVVIWDNRRVSHSAVIDWDEPVSRHAFRITPQAERPVEDLKDLNKGEDDLGDVEAALNNLLR